MERSERERLLLGSLVDFVTAKGSCARQDIMCAKEAENSTPGSSKFESESVWLRKLQSL